MEKSELFRERARPFIVDNESNKTIYLRFEGKKFLVGPTGANGYAFAEITVQDSLVQSVNPTNNASTSNAITLEIDAPDSPSHGETLVVPLIPPNGISVISDLDDTIKVSNVEDKRALLLNTFCDKFREVPGMATLYRTWASTGAAFHYVTASPWQLHAPVLGFLRDTGFPSGSLVMKIFRWKDSSFFDLFAKSDEVKKPAIEQIIQSFPRRKFILVGDSGERDPELYAEIARKFPSQVQNVFIRNSGSSATIDNIRYAKAFEGVPAEKYSIFSDPNELRAATKR